MVMIDLGIKRKAGDKTTWVYTTFVGEDNEAINKMLSKLVNDETVEKVTITKK